MNNNLDWMARLVFIAALVEDRCGELMQALFDGASATVDHSTGKLVIVSKEMLDQL